MKALAPALWPAPRALACLLAVALALAIGAFWPPSILVAFALGAAAAGACAADFISGPRARDVDLLRVAPERCALLATAFVEYRLTNRSIVPLHVRLVETPVPFVEFEQDGMTFKAGAGTTTAATRSFSLTERGNTSFGAIYLSVGSELGFLERRFRIDLPHALRINPDLSAVGRRGSLAHQVRVRESGSRRLRLRGSGSQYAGLREYGEGDAYRDVDWKSTARRGKLMVVEREIERSQQIVIMLDGGRTMWPRVGAQRKFDYAVTAALSMATLAQTADDRVGLHAFAATPIAAVSPGRGIAHASSLATALFPLQPRLEEPDYERAVADVRRRYTRRSLIVLFTGALDPLASETLIDALSLLVPRHVVMCVLVDDASLVQAAAEPPQNVRDAYRSAIALRGLSARARAVGLLRERGVIVVDVPVGQLTLATMDAYLSIKTRGSL